MSIGNNRLEVGRQMKNNRHFLNIGISLFNQLYYLLQVVWEVELGFFFLRSRFFHLWYSLNFHLLRLPLWPSFWGPDCLRSLHQLLSRWYTNLHKSTYILKSSLKFRLNIHIPIYIVSTVNQVILVRCQVADNFII